MKKSISFLISLIFLSLFTACRKTDTINDNSFIDLTGLQFSLEWSLSNSTADPTDGTNLDLELTYNNTIVQESNSNFGFESLELKQNNPNGNYNLNIYYYQGEQPLNFTINVRGLSSSKNRQYTGTLSPANKGETFTVISITKDGDNYNLF